MTKSGIGTQQQHQHMAHTSPGTTAASAAAAIAFYNHNHSHHNLLLTTSMTSSSTAASPNANGAASSSSSSSTRHNNNNTHHQHQHQQQQQQVATTSSNSTAAACSASANIATIEIPIWIGEKKKWVTGLSKKTTVNDVIFAVLKQCGIIPPPISGQADQRSSSPSQQQMSSSNATGNTSEQYVLVECKLRSTSPPSLEDAHGNGVDMYATSTSSRAASTLCIDSQSLLKGTSKVYKLMHNWTSSASLLTNQLDSSIMLKILKKEEGSPPPPSTHTSEQHHHQQQEQNNNISSNNGHKQPSLATKLFKRLKSHSSASSPSPASSSEQQQQQQQMLTSASSTNIRFVDVQLPPTNMTTTTTTTAANGLASNGDEFARYQQQQQNTPYETDAAAAAAAAAMTMATMSNGGEERSFDPSTPKSFLLGSVMARDVKLRQQIERFKLLDELLKESDRTSRRLNSIAPAQSERPPLHNYQMHQQQPQQQQQHIDQPHVEMSDVYSHFPEMCTHQPADVKDFTLVCTQLFELDEAIRAQRQALDLLESELERELSAQQSQPVAAPAPKHAATSSSFLAANEMLDNNNSSSGGSEMSELRQQVNASREQTRMQCKQLHDLDLQTRQSEQAIQSKESQLKQLLEQLYIEQEQIEQQQQLQQQQQQLQQHVTMDFMNGRDRVDCSDMMPLAVAKSTRAAKHQSKQAHSNKQAWVSCTCQM